MSTNHIEKLRQAFVEAREARKVATIAEREAALAVSLAMAENDGIGVGDIVEFRYGGRTSLGRVLKIGWPRYGFSWGKSYSVHVLIIKKDGSDGERQTELRSNDFFPLFEGEKPAARIVSKKDAS